MLELCNDLYSLLPSVQVICEFCNNCRDLDLCRDTFIATDEASGKLVPLHGLLLVCMCMLSHNVTLYCTLPVGLYGTALTAVTLTAVTILSSASSTQYRDGLCPLFSRIWPVLSATGYAV